MARPLGLEHYLVSKPFRSEFFPLQVVTGKIFTYYGLKWPGIVENSNVKRKKSYTQCWH